VCGRRESMMQLGGRLCSSAYGALQICFMIMIIMIMIMPVGLLSFFVNYLRALLKCLSSGIPLL